VGRLEEHRAALRGLPAGEWDAYLAANSGLPGPRADLELARADPDRLARLRSLACLDRSRRSTVDSQGGGSDPALGISICTVWGRLPW
jgi:hypothetical protein